MRLLNKAAARVRPAPAILCHSPARRGLQQSQRRHRDHKRGCRSSVRDYGTRVQVRCRFVKDSDLNLHARNPGILRVWGPSVGCVGSLHKPNCRLRNLTQQLVTDCYRQRRRKQRFDTVCLIYATPGSATGDGVDAPRRHLCAKVTVSKLPPKEASMEQTATIGLDLSLIHI